MNIKKYLSALLAICLLAGCLTGCGDKADGNTTDSKKNTSQTTADTLSSKYTYKATFTPLKAPDDRRDYRSARGNRQLRQRNSEY